MFSVQSRQQRTPLTAAAHALFSSFPLFQAMPGQQQTGRPPQPSFGAPPTQQPPSQQRPGFGNAPPAGAFGAPPSSGPPQVSIPPQPPQFPPPGFPQQQIGGQQPPQVRGDTNSFGLFIVAQRRQAWNRRRVSEWDGTMMKVSSSRAGTMMLDVAGVLACFASGSTCVVCSGRYPVFTVASLLWACVLLLLAQVNQQGFGRAPAPGPSTGPTGVPQFPNQPQQQQQQQSAPASNTQQFPPRQQPPPQQAISTSSVPQQSAVQSPPGQQLVTAPGQFGGQYGSAPPTVAVTSAPTSQAFGTPGVSAAPAPTPSAAPRFDVYGRPIPQAQQLPVPGPAGTPAPGGQPYGQVTYHCW